MSEPRECWITDTAMSHGEANDWGDIVSLERTDMCDVHVIEKSAADKLAEAIGNAEAALAYMTLNMDEHSEIDRVRDKMRETLKEYRGDNA